MTLACANPAGRYPNGYAVPSPIYPRGYRPLSKGLISYNFQKAPYPHTLSTPFPDRTTASSHQTPIKHLLSSHTPYMPPTDILGVQNDNLWCRQTPSVPDNLRIRRQSRHHWTAILIFPKKHKKRPHRTAPVRSR